MNALAANDIEATDLLALARPGSTTTARRAAAGRPGGPVPDMIATAQEP
jgi:hypothetical protein